MRLSAFPGKSISALSMLGFVREVEVVSRSWKSLWKSECGTIVPVYRVLVPESVNEEILRAWTSRGYRCAAGAPSPIMLTGGMRRNFFRSSILFKGGTATGSAVTAGLAAPAGLAWISGFGEAALTLGAAGGASAVGTGIVAAVLGPRYFRDPKRLSRRNRRKAAEAQWITPATLGFVPGRKDGRDTDEQRLFHLAVTIARKIVRTRAWTHPILADHVSRVDLDHAVASVGVRLAELVKLREEIESIRDERTSATVEAYLSKLAIAFTSMANRVVSMHGYYERLVALDRQLMLLHNSERSRELGDRVLDVLSRTAADDSADWQFRELRIDAESHSEVISGLVAELDETADTFDDFDTRLAAAEESMRALDTAPRRGREAGAPD
ncbi:hypothetical protein DFO66_101220 [Brevibacterium sanguinis]|uniref:Uncharacterized protein n=2 Tax=Brevibacterium TaxID=1696 RepID=A0A366IR43_9MICO|nr:MULTISPECIES: hypothetical protein [Brevibacterium]RBP67996.1 hypothetical protein DFO66_101220 [Brevibacterium sanguinis]RBP74587.1 hypothetical protein DFO65_101309 [Brevibacterium celere]